MVRKPVKILMTLPSMDVSNANFNVKNLAHHVYMEFVMNVILQDFIYPITIVSQNVETLQSEELKNAMMETLFPMTAVLNAIFNVNNLAWIVSKPFVIYVNLLGH